MKFNLALIGFGGVNHGLAEVIRQKQAMLADRYGMTLNITAVSDMRFGTIWHEDGLDLDALIALPAKGYAVDDVLAKAGTQRGGASLAETLSMIQLNCVDVVLEATFTNPQTGEPALSHCRTALSAGKHLITTNKGPLALAGHALQSLASEMGVQFLFEGTVMSGTPVLRQLDVTLRGCDISGFRGILNGTCNFVLSQVEAGASFADAIREAQQLGYAEADPTADVEGWDVQLKVAILANALWGNGMKPAEIAREGITGLSEQQVREARAEGYAWRLIGEGRQQADGSINGTVGPQKLPLTDPLLAAHGANNAVTFTTDLLGAMTVSGPGAGRHETAFAMLSDLIDLNDRIKK
ncbi:homoserine dehydrogenase [Leeia oryzae]|uniref:homoserine dehydrogenase n=1 Tax=Leeia oryzae TaxID=356662 RepID=UPI00036A4899|nr:homoserine dehydrogenase [Leeia oryzae]